jgi:hypothetical protein
MIMLLLMSCQQNMHAAVAGGVLQDEAAQLHPH